MSRARPKPAPYNRGNPRVKVYAKMRPDLKKLIARRAREQGMSPSAWLEQAAERQLLQEDDQEGALTG